MSLIIPSLSGSPSEKPSRTRKITGAVLLSVGFLTQGCSSTSGAMMGGGIGSVGGPIGAIVGAGVGERIGNSSSKIETSKTRISEILSQIPDSEFRNITKNWPSVGVIYIIQNGKVHITPIKRDTNMVTFEVKGWDNTGLFLGDTLHTVNMTDTKKKS